MKEEEESSSVVEDWYNYLEILTPYYTKEEIVFNEQLDREKEELEGEVVEVTLYYPPETVKSLTRLGIIKKEELGE